MDQAREFTCVIEDSHLKERFSAMVNIKKKIPISAAEQEDRIALAHIYITPVSGQLRKRRYRIHHHFVLFDFTGRGMYIVRDQNDQTEHRRECSTWDLGHAFAIRVMDAFRELA
jgi:hypothetical protein